jgi:hypothetical protein
MTLANDFRMNLLLNGNVNRSKKSRDSVLPTRKKNAGRRNNNVDKTWNDNESCNGNVKRLLQRPTRRNPPRDKLLRKDDKRWSGQSRWELLPQLFDLNRVATSDRLCRGTRSCQPSQFIEMRWANPRPVDPKRTSQGLSMEG